MGAEEPDGVLCPAPVLFAKIGTFSRNAMSPSHLLALSLPTSSVFAFSNYFLWVPIVLPPENSQKSPTPEATLAKAGIMGILFLTLGSGWMVAGSELQGPQIVP